jgi:hypothetical protein
MMDHKVSVQTFNRIEWKAYLLIMNNITLCNLCKTNQAEIFQESGYCLCCWQEITCPNV